MASNSAEWKPFFYPLRDESDPDEDPPTWREVQVLYDFVELFRTADAIPAASAAVCLMSLCEEDRLMEERPAEQVDKGWRISDLLWGVALAMPHHQPAILELVDAVRALPELERTEEQIQKRQFEGPLLNRWRDLEQFEEEWQRAVDDIWGFQTEAAARYWGDSLEGTEAYPAINAFYANDLKRRPLDTIRPQQMVRAFRYITFALEQDPWNHAPPRPSKIPKEELERLGLRDTSFVPTDYILILNADVHGIVPFFEIAGNIIFHFIDKVDISWMEKKLPNSNLWNGSSLFTMDRWEFWKDRLRWIGQKAELMERTREDAERLIRIMQNTQDLQSRSS